MIILASNSPRRKELLRRITTDFIAEPARLDERALPVLKPAPYVQSLATAKGRAVAANHAGDTVIAADTMVAFGDDLLGKPADEVAAAQMLNRLSGNTHHVYTGLYVRLPNGQERTQVVVTAVTFWPLTEALIAAYLATGEYRDKAGSYAIQGKGALLVREIVGDFYNVVGLPISTLSRMLD